MRVSLVLGLGVFLASMAASSLSWARVPTRLVYVRSQSTSGCPDQSVLEAAVAARLGYEPFSPWGDQTIVATISRRSASFVARAELVDHDGIVQGSREVRASLADCAELIATLALAISITLDPMHAAPTPAAAENPPSPANDPEVPPEPGTAALQREDATAVGPAPPRRANSVARRASRRDHPRRSSVAARFVELEAHAGIVGALATVPHPALGGRAGVGLRRAAFSAWLEGWATLPSSESAGGEREVRISLLSSALALCLDLVEPLSACAQSSLGRLFAEGHGVLEPRAESVFYATLGVRGLVTVPLGTLLALLGNVDVSTVLTRPTFQLNNADVWRPGAVAAAAGLGVSVRFF